MFICSFQKHFQSEYCGCMKRSLPGYVRVGQDWMKTTLYACFLIQRILMSMYERFATCHRDWRQRGCCLAVLQPEGNAFHQLLAFLLPFSKRFEYQGRSCARYVGGEPTRWMLSWWTKKSTINPVSAVNIAEINWGEWKSTGNPFLLLLWI